MNANMEMSEYHCNRKHWTAKSVGGIMPIKLKHFHVSIFHFRNPWNGFGHSGFHYSKNINL